MNSLEEYLKITRTQIDTNLSSFHEVHIVIGNESCDLDSTVSSLVLACFLNKYRIPQISDTALVIPVLNVFREHFLLRVDNCFVLHECGISLKSLIFRDEVNIKELLKIKAITTSLVDHHVLLDDILRSTVIQIFDHRPFDVDSNWNKNIILRIEDVGSCSTLIADEILRVDENFLSRNIAYAIYETIIFDTVALLPEVGRAKELDRIIAEKLEDKFSFIESRKTVYDKLWAAHNDVSNLLPKQVLIKDLKIVEGVPVPGLPMLVERFLKSCDAYNALEDMASEYKVSLLVLIGLDVTEEVKRDVGIFWRQHGEDLKNTLLSKLQNSKELKGYDFDFKTINVEHCNIVCLRQNNVTLSRKQIIPLIKDAVLENGKLE